MPVDYKVRSLRRLFGEASFLRPALDEDAPKARGKIVRESVKLLQERAALKSEDGGDDSQTVRQGRRRTKASGGVPRSVFSEQPPRSIRNKTAGALQFNVHLVEKQKMKLYYGAMRDDQFKRYVDKAQSKRLHTDAALLRMLETRLDTFLYRTGFVKTPGQGRQWIFHDLVLINGKRVNIKSYRMRPGDVLAIRDSHVEQAMGVSQETAEMRQSFACGASWIVSRADSAGMLPWMEIDRVGLSAVLVREPTDDEARSMARAALFPYIRDANLSPHAAMRAYR